MHATGWSRGLEVTGGGTGVVSHAGLVLLRQLADRTGLTSGLSAALPSPLGGHDRGRVFSDLACAIADGARVISDFRVMGDQRELFGPVASVPTAWRALKEIAAGGDRRRRKVTAAVNKARRHAWAHGIARHGGLPPVRVADRRLEGVTCIRLDATVVTAHSDKELAEPNFKGYGHHPIIAACDNTAEPLAWMLRPGSAGQQHRRRSPAPAGRRDRGAAAGAAAQADDHLRRGRRQPRPGQGAGPARRPARLPGHLLRRLGARRAGEGRDRQGPRAPPGRPPIDGKGEVRERRADDACADQRCAHRKCWIEEAHVTELTGLLREGPAGDQLKGWPKTMRVFARRERPHPGAQLSLFEAADGWRYSLWVTNLPAATRGWRGQCAYIDAAHRVHARVEDVIRTGKDTGLGHFPSHDYGLNKAWLDAAMIACILLSWLKLLALDGDLARAEPKTLRYRVLHAAARLVRGGRRRTLKIAATWPWAEEITTAWQRVQAIPHPT